MTGCGKDIDLGACQYGSTVPPLSLHQTSVKIPAWWCGVRRGTGRGTWHTAGTAKMAAVTHVSLLEANTELDQIRGKETLQRKCKKVERGWERAQKEMLFHV